MPVLTLKNLSETTPIVLLLGTMIRGAIFNGPPFPASLPPDLRKNFSYFDYSTKTIPGSTTRSPRRKPPAVSYVTSTSRNVGEVALCVLRRRLDTWFYPLVFCTRSDVLSKGLRYFTMILLGIQGHRLGFVGRYGLCAQVSADWQTRDT